MLKLDKATLDNNTAGTEGGGVAVKQGATAYITRSEFTFNNAPVGGGLQSDGTVTTDGVVFSRNFAANHGGAIDHDLGDAVYRNTTLKDNAIGKDGGGIDIDDGTVQFINSKILDNTTTGAEGGGIWNAASLTLIKTEVSGNVAGGSGGKGGGIHNEGTMVLRDSSVDRNSANGSGNSRGGGILRCGRCGDARPQPGEQQRLHRRTGRRGHRHPVHREPVRDPEQHPHQLRRQPGHRHRLRRLTPHEPNPAGICTSLPYDTSKPRSGDPYRGFELRGPEGI
ncbi:right-handed parallel beta-helix repeat-containing protein [Streptomyces sp. NPDC047022]|uniref:right-handed parallel beta-helix repeat-containing protein n=1 Tax=Streptomyces sp. NPDC047022 TaxID=3155737 RepID=UPI0033E3F39A